MSVSFHRFANISRRRDSTIFYYYSYNLQSGDGALSELSADAGPRDFLRIEDPLRLSSAPIPEGTDYLWMGSNGVVAEAHYDRNHNFVAQISGRKEFILFAKQSDDLDVHPFYHPRDRQSQLYYYSSDEGGGAHALQTKIRANGHVVLSPGDVLYIPTSLVAQGKGGTGQSLDWSQRVERFAGERHLFAYQLDRAAERCAHTGDTRERNCAVPARSLRARW